MAASETGPRKMRLIASASSIGTVIELYDFVIFASVAALVFPKIFFPALGSAAGTVASFATLGVAFVARPVGSILFGHFGDRLGRKRTLVSTLLLMGIATVLVGAMPTADQIGVAAPLLVVAMRILQGIAVGGEWTGATLMAAEYAPKPRRGFWSMFASLGGAIGSALALATLLVTRMTMSDAAFLSYGWRIPFLASVLLLLVGLYIRGSIEETPVFKEEIARRGAASAPLLEAIKHQPREVLFGSGVLLTVFAFIYMVLGYMISYGTAELGLSETTVLAITILASVVIAPAIVLGGALSDRIGRRTVIIGGNAVAVFWALALFPVLGSASAATFAVGACVTMIIAGVTYGPVGAFMPELFHTRYRYSATGFSYNIAGVLGGAVPGVVAAATIDTYGSLAFGAFLAVLCLIGLGCTVALGETKDAEMGSGDGYGHRSHRRHRRLVKDENALPAHRLR
ncbi:MHS family MFS transporter [Actinomadura madurae]|uniref:Sugar phosphate permease n=1 Tax=Actinomadura madurae TaxID=1993 RepID=A0A1I5MAQ3_9ACTN|nr:MFS transporter [Actinomadura madurae]SFP06652.1 Sugar phosphate permease [Actinomadura madurae]SPT60941.1 Inner membrane metabolite transport protein yhjE [Actinomadura madurae]